MQTAIPCSLYRGGTSKGLYFHARDLPADVPTRDRVLLSAMGSPDPRQIDGLGGADPLTSKAAIVSPSDHPEADVDFLFLQVFVDQPVVSDSQNCGNLLAAVGPFAIEEGLVAATGPVTEVRIRMVNSDSFATATIATPGGRVAYDGDCAIDGVPGAASPIPIEFKDLAGSTCGALLPTERLVDCFEGVEATCIDNGMPVVIVRAADFGLRGDEAPETLEADEGLKSRIEAVRLLAGEAMGMGDVSAKSAPKVTLVSRPLRGGGVHTRTFIPHRVHKTIGVFGAVSVATAACMPGSVAASVANAPSAAGDYDISIEHAAGAFALRMALEAAAGGISIRRAALLRTARRLMSGQLFIPGQIWRPA